MVNGLPRMRQAPASIAVVPERLGGGLVPGVAILITSALREARAGQLVLFETSLGQRVRPCV